MDQVFRTRFAAAFAATVSLMCVLAAPSSAADVSVTLPCVDLTVVQVNCTPATPATPAPKPKPACQDTDLEPTRSNLARIRASTLCLLNKERKRHHLAKLRGNTTLKNAARSYARKMVRDRFFDHTSPDGTTMVQRILRTAYVRVAPRYWWVGENIAWGSVKNDSPAKIVSAWMHSAGHRRNILNTHYRDIGLGMTIGTPGEGPGTTYVTDFGRRIR